MATTEIILRRAVEADAAAAWRILDAARRRMLDAGKRQWSMTYPSQANVGADIASDAAMVAVDQGGEIVGYCCAPLTGEPAYDALDEEWITGGPYLTVHRLAVAPSALRRGVARAMMRLLEGYARDCAMRSIRVDTNYDNDAMLSMLASLGYARCGTVRYPSGERITFEKPL